MRISGQRYLNPPEYVASLAAAVRARGGQIVEGCNVHDRNLAEGDLPAGEAVVEMCSHEYLPFS